MTSTPVLYDYLQNALTQISSSMTANLPTLNSSRTEFLLIGLSKQLAKINNSSLNTTHAVRNLSFIFGEHLTFPDQISSVSKSRYYHCRQLRMYPSMSSFQNSLHYCHFRCPLHARLLQPFFSQPAQVADHPAATHPELSCARCCKNPKSNSCGRLSWLVSAIERTLK